MVVIMLSIPKKLNKVLSNQILTVITLIKGSQEVLDLLERMTLLSTTANAKEGVERYKVEDWITHPSSSPLVHRSSPGDEG